MNMNETNGGKSGLIRVAAGLALALACGAAMAQSEAAGSTGWVKFINNLTSIGTAGATAVTALCFLLGLAAIGFGGKLLWDKGGERGEDIKMGRIVFTILGGTILVALGFVAQTTVQTMGGQSSDVGASTSPPR